MKQQNKNIDFSDISTLKKKGALTGFSWNYLDCIHLELDLLTDFFVVWLAPFKDLNYFFVETTVAI